MNILSVGNMIILENSKSMYGPAKGSTIATGVNKCAKFLHVWLELHVYTHSEQYITLFVMD